MRVSIEENDPGYTHGNLDYNIYLNNTKCDGTYTADEELGYIKKMAFADNGAVATKNHEIVTEELYGNIRIVGI